MLPKFPSKNIKHALLGRLDKAPIPQDLPVPHAQSYLHAASIRLRRSVDH